MVEAAGTETAVEKRKRAKNWDTHEILLLVQARKEEWERQEVSPKVEPAAEKWAKVVEFLHSKGIEDRDSDQCRGKWDNLLSDYKTVRDWRKHSGTRLYASLTRDEKKLNKLPACFDSQVMDLLETFQGKKSATQFIPMITIDSSTTMPPEPIEEDELADEARQEKDARLEGGRRRKRRSPDMISVLQDVKESYLSTVMGVEKRRDKRHAKSLEFEKEKLVMEREDRRELISVLGDIAKVFERIADKM